VDQYRVRGYQFVLDTSSELACVSFKPLFRNVDPPSNVSPSFAASERSHEREPPSATRLRGCNDAKVRGCTLHGRFGGKPENICSF
jgi:hypothetical protein